ncbi:hypothetical protein RHMOL_Rhmol01G0317100 [Rhododendron molle]|uniref:Uncharacterized protein n=1 Tax=Rhododendron molle TaxID=49168 RepID=A0ACC0Q7I5_RHOML|nr:hypothetical protein RHMOL_Rhmol01G0317100 [Rhododendron molle]
MQKQGRHNWVVLVPCPFQGHITPMLQLGHALHSKGFSIVVAHTKFNSPNSSNHPDFVFLPIPDNFSHQGNPFEIITALNANSKEPFMECLAQFMEKHKPDDRVSCIISDIALNFLDDVTKDLNVQSIVLSTNNASFNLALSGIPRLHAQGLIPVQDSTLQDLVPELHPLRFKDIPVSSFATLEEFLEKLRKSKRSSSAVVWNTMELLEQRSLAQLQQHDQCPFFIIGPLHKIVPSCSTSLLKEESSCISWLDNQAPNSVIYVSLGSTAFMDEKALVEMAWGLANSHQPFLWVIRPGSVRGSQWIELLPEKFTEQIGDRGCIVKWAPQKEVLAHKAVGGFWSHCGWNSTLESICEGVPVICWPCFGDQKVNARYLSTVWGIGLELEHEAERGEIERAVKRLLVDKEGKEIRRRAIELKERTEVSTREGGSSFNSLNALVEHILSF